MEKENEFNKFLGTLEEDQNGFEEQSEDPFAHLNTEEPIVEPEAEKPLPFNQDPKVQKYIAKQVAKALADRPEPTATVREAVNDDTTSVVEAFTAIIGNDTPEKLKALKSLENALGNVDQRASKIAIDKIEEIKSREIAQDRAAEQELEDAFDDIEDSYGVDITSNNAIARKTRQEFVTFVEKIAPKDRNGEIIDYPDMNSAWETFSQIKKATTVPSRNKELANRGMARSTETPIGPQKRVTFNDADAFIESLSG